MKPPDELRKDLVGQWLKKAEEDFGVAEFLLAEKSPYLSAAGFHLQQAAEKYLKALLVRHQVEFPKTHDLGKLLDLLATVEAPLSPKAISSIRSSSSEGEPWPLSHCETPTCETPAIAPTWVWFQPRAFRDWRIQAPTRWLDMPPS